MNEFRDKTGIDKMELGVIYKNQGLSQSTFKKIIRTHSIKINKAKTGYEFERTINKNLYTVKLYYSAPEGLRICVYPVLNGNWMYKKDFKLKSSNNCIAFEEIKEKEKSVNSFAVDRLPTLLFTEVDYIFKDVRNWLNGTLKGININRKPIKNTSTSFQEIECMTDIHTLKSDKYEPANDSNLLASLATICKEIEVKDYIVKKDKYVPASDKTYCRGHRIVFFTIYEHAIRGKLYLKLCDDIFLYDVIRFELCFKNKKDGVKTDTIKLVADGKKRFNTEQDIRDILFRITEFTSEKSEIVLSGISTTPKKMNLKKTKVKIRKLLHSHDIKKEEHLESLVDAILTGYVPFYKVKISTLPRRLREKIRELSKSNTLFREAYPSFGDYIFDRNKIEKKEKKGQSASDGTVNNQSEKISKG